MYGAPGVSLDPKGISPGLKPAFVVACSAWAEAQAYPRCNRKGGSVTTEAAGATATAAADSSAALRNDKQIGMVGGFG
jgi:hypothetical protein